MILWRPLRRKGVGVVQLMIVSIGLSLALRYTFQFFIGGGTSQLPYSVGAEDPAVRRRADERHRHGVASRSRVVVIIAFALWLIYSRIGKATRAISDNPSLAAASGIDVDFVVRVVWVSRARMAGLAGILYAYYRPGIKWDMGAQVLLLMFAAVTLGGLGTAFGALSARSSSACSSRCRASGSPPTSSTRARCSSSSSSCCSDHRASSAAARE